MSLDLKQQQYLLKKQEEQNRQLNKDISVAGGGGDSGSLYGILLILALLPWLYPTYLAYQYISQPIIFLEIGRPLSWLAIITIFFTNVFIVVKVFYKLPTRLFPLLGALEFGGMTYWFFSIPFTFGGIMLIAFMACVGFIFFSILSLDYRD